MKRVVHVVSSAMLMITSTVVAFDIQSNKNLAVYWGQNSYGASHPDYTDHWQQRLAHYCKDSVIDTIHIAFLTEFYGEGDLPSINLSNTCNSGNSAEFPGTQLLDCSFIASDIEECQVAGKIITLSIGGATGGSVVFQNDIKATEYAQVIWDTFLGGTSSTRPFGTAVLDGIDMDIEGGSQTGYAPFLKALRKLMDASEKKFYLTAAPQCVFPDANLGDTLNAVGFDAVYVQFYNNWCGVQNYDNPDAWNFGTWDNWAKTVSPNRDVKVYLGAPASSSAGSGYVDAGRLSTIILETMTQYSSFGGVMLWDASQAYANNRYDESVKNALVQSETVVGPTPTSTTATETFTTTSPTASPTSCTGMKYWKKSSIYVKGNRVKYRGHLWMAKWWTRDDVPGGDADVWVDEGSC
ncbi:glycoside hydrolase family 18 protein [Suillus clintonianus]|uniref:glycoside hydrolase family 18 protein n=1 Tax=Suillus clintonianus TaxID=1904413 RepID=UPI001B86B9CF|nr:glycoside hydrolase family 18 protein [Suillus clintonianus]KAG2119368.1 glycoside hydrolase family 18 protein [Suillus clintonianus]